MLPSNFTHYRGAAIEVIPRGSRYAFAIHLNIASTVSSVKTDYLTRTEALAAAKLVASLIR